MKNLLLFASQFPAKKGDGNFLKNEIEILSQSFDNVYIARLEKLHVEDFDLPKNVKVIFNGLKNRREVIKLGIFNASSIGIVLKLLSQDISKFKKLKHIKWFFYAVLLGRAIKANKEIRKLFNYYSEEDLTLYFFWGTGLAYVIPWLNKFKNNITIKLHGGDLYTYRRGYIPFRKSIYKRADHLVTISNDGQNYLKKQLKKFNIKDDKISLIRLGTRNRNLDLKNKIISENVKIIVSCSAIEPVKRVPLIFKVLNEASKLNNIKWIHFGDGKDMNLLKEQIKKTHLNNLTVKLKGYTLNENILNFYSKNKIDLFINLSSSEGIPVSIMEAISYGIPILSTDVGGTSEIVGKLHSTGILVPQKVNIENTAFEVNKILKGEYSFNPKKFWRDNFDCDKNNKKLIQVLQD